MGLEGGGWESRSARPGREKRGGGGKRRKRRREGKESTQGDPDYKGRRVQEEVRACSPRPRLPGRDSGAAAAAPGRAALALLREVARRAKEGRARAVGRGDYAISERRIGCIQSQSGCKLTAGPRSRGVQGDRGVGGS